MKNFVFLVCSERSGSNFITSLMNGHSHISGPPPTHLFRLFGTNRGNYGNLAHDDSWQALTDDMALNFSRKLGTWLTTITADELRDQARERSAAELLRVVYEKEAEADGASHIFVKENHTSTFAAFLLAHFQDAHFVFLIRDPRDVASSWVKTCTIPGGIEKAVEVWLEDQIGALALYDQLRDSGRGLLVRYEDLVADAPATLRQLTDYLGLPYEDRMLAFNQDRRTRANAARIDAWANLQRPVLSNNSGKYRTVLSETDQRYVELACGEWMDRLGYVRDLGRDDPSPDERRALLDSLRRDVNPGGYEIPSEQEQAIRNQRLAGIQQVLVRRL